jgi:hypothetical protein
MTLELVSMARGEPIRELQLQFSCLAAGIGPAERLAVRSATITPTMAGLARRARPAPQRRRLRTAPAAARLRRGNVGYGAA